jgi:hypothetical protein
VPQNPDLLGLQVAAQGIDAFVPGGCSFPIDLTLTDAIVVTIL